MTEEGRACGRVQLATLFEAIPAPPVTLDTAAAHLVEPDVSHRCPKRAEAAATGSAAQPSVVSGIRSLFGL